jgi:hypothetical protein
MGHYGSVMICNHKQGHYSDRRICDKDDFNEIHYNPATSTFTTFLVCLVLKSLHTDTQNMLLRIESSGRYTHHKQAKVIHYYIEKES